MTLPALWASALPALLALALVAWAVATLRRNVGLVDIAWPLFFLVAIALYCALAPALAARGMLAAAIATAWAVRLASHLAARNWNAPEDWRYREIRARNEPHFAWKSLYLVFGFQAVLAWLIAAPLAASAAGTAPLGFADLAGAALAVFGVGFEAAADAQLARFKREGQRGRVLDQGLWRYSRHPNYFGEACTWWGLGLIAAGAGAWWTLFSPALMTLLLVRVTGVALLERGMAERRPGYREYVARTSAFIPWPPRNA